MTLWLHNALDNSRGSSRFMQDGAKLHRKVEIFDFPLEHFDDRGISVHFMNHRETGMNCSPPPIHLI